MTPAVQAARSAGIEFTLHEYAGVEVGDGDYARSVAAALGRPEGQLFKTLVVSVDSDLRAFVVKNLTTARPTAVINLDAH